jgi:cell division septal protein FtsQ
MDRDRLLSPRVRELKQKRQKQALVKRGIIFFVILILLAVLIYVSRLPKLQISNITVSGNDLTRSEDVVKIVNKIFSNKYLFLIPKGNAFLYSKSEIENKLKEEFPRIVSLSIDQLVLNDLNIKIKERSSTYLWCGKDVPKVNEIPECYYVDNEGYIFAKAPTFTGPVYFVFFGTKNENVNENPIGQEIFEREEFLNIVRFVEIIKEKIHPYAIAFYDTNIFTILLSKDFNDEKQKIVFSDTGLLPEISVNLISALNAEPLKTKLVDSFDDLEYIDLRYEDKVYYKFRKDGLQN